MYCINCGERLSHKELYCSCCNFSIYDAQKLLIQQLQQKEEAEQKSEKVEEKNWICQICHTKNSYEYCFCKKCTSPRKLEKNDNSSLNVNIDIPPSKDKAIDSSIKNEWTKKDKIFGVILLILSGVAIIGALLTQYGYFH